MGDKLLLLKKRQPSDKILKSRAGIRHSIAETMAGDSAETAKTFGTKAPFTGKPASGLSADQLEIIKLEMACYSVFLNPPPALAATDLDEDQLQEVCADIRVKKMSVLAGRCLQKAKRAAEKNERSAWKAALQDFLKKRS